MVAEHEKRQTIELLADQAVRGGLYAYLTKLADQWEFETPIWAVHDEVKPAVRANLIGSLTGGETPEEASKLMRRRRFKTRST